MRLACKCRKNLERNDDTMKVIGAIRRVDDLGRIVIPKEIRRLVFGKTNATGEPMKIFIDGENIVLRRYEEVQTCKWIKYGYRTICPKNHGDADDPYWMIPANMDKLKYCPYCGKEIVVEDMEVGIMSKWRDIRCDFFNEEEEKYMVDAWKTDNDSEEGTVIAKLDLADGTVEYIDEDAKTDKYAQTVIKEMLENGYILTE